MSAYCTGHVEDHLKIVLYELSKLPLESYTPNDRKACCECLETLHSRIISKTSIGGKCLEYNANSNAPAQKGKFENLDLQKALDNLASSRLSSASLDEFVDGQEAYNVLAILDLIYTRARGPPMSEKFTAKRGSTAVRCAQESGFTVDHKPLSEITPADVPRGLTATDIATDWPPPPSSELVSWPPWSTAEKK